MTESRASSPALSFEKIPLNSVQREAVTFFGAPQLVFAGAGTGKTRVLTAKIAYLIEAKKINSQSIFAATFTNKAAAEMRERLEALLGMSCKGMWIGTFHSLCSRILRREAAFLGYDRNFTIYDADDQLSLVRKILKERSIDEKSISPRQALSAISRYKNSCTLPEECALEKAVGFYEREIVEIYKMYAKSLKQQNAMDFDDLIANPVYLFRKHPDLLESYRRQFQYVLVDEYQDTNVAQFRLVHLLASQHRNIFVVGDDDQSIYGWRGANVENILNFEYHFPHTHVTKLEQNYRSTQPILSLAHAVITSNARRAEKKLWTSRQGGDEVVISKYRDDRHEADAVCAAIRERTSRGVAAGDIGILFRTNAQSRVFEDTLRRYKMPYVLVGAMSFYERKEVKDCLAYLRLLVNPSDDISCERILNVPARGIGDKSRDTLFQAARQSGASLLQTILSGTVKLSLSKAQQGIDQLREQFLLLIDAVKSGEPPNLVFDSLLKLTGYLDSLQAEDSEEAEGRIDNVNELLNTLAQWSIDNPGQGLSAFLEEVSLASDVDRWNPGRDRVNVMTLHSAKGLEFDTVFLVGLEEGILPSGLNLDDPDRMEEECRLLYVGITRAKQQLRCSFAARRWRFGSVVPMDPSRYIGAIPPGLSRFNDESLMPSFAPSRSPVREPVLSQSWSVRQNKSPTVRHAEESFSQDTVQYRMGQQVLHKTYGAGKIVNLSGFGPDLRLTVLFSDGVRRKLVAKYANLEPV